MGVIEGDARSLDYSSYVVERGKPLFEQDAVF